jgi:cytochrome c-type biogenesis protein CcmH
MWEQVTEMKSISFSADSVSCVGTGALARPSRAQLGTCRPPRQLWIRSSRWLQAASLAVAVIVFMGAGDDSARFKDLGHRMMCACGCGQILLECNHVGCTYSDKMRDQLQAAIDKGNNDDLILQGFVQNYGPTVIAAPTATGFNRVAWIMPFAALAFGISFVVYVVRAWKNRPTPALADGIIIQRGNQDELDEFRRKARKETDL